MKKIKSDFGSLDILVNNAGITGFAPNHSRPDHENKKASNDSNIQDPENATLESWHEVHRVNLDGVFLGCKHGIG